jgi:hypothetical protein
MTESEELRIFRNPEASHASGWTDGSSKLLSFLAARSSRDRSAGLLSGRPARASVWLAALLLSRHAGFGLLTAGERHASKT